MYRIKIDYTTGNSFGSQRETRYIEGTWSNIEALAENLRRIKEHYEWVTDRTSTYSSKPKKRPDPPPYAHEKYPEFSIKLLLDDGKEYDYSVFWTGYFEQLHGASIELEMGFKVYD